MALKRAYSPSSQILVVPDLPKLSGETLLQVFTHKSLRRADQEPFDNERLSLLGERFFQMLITDALLGQRPMLTALEITVNANLHSTSNFTIPSKAQKDRFFSSNYVTLLVRQYGLLNRLRCHPNIYSALHTPEEASSVLHAYIGGIYVDHGNDGPLQAIVQTWIHIFLASSQNTPPLKKIRMDPDPELDSSAHSFPQPSNQQILPDPLALAQPNLTVLSSLNQTASQRGATLDYPGNFDHALGQWTVQCVVNGVPKGEGSHTDRKTAKELAAKQAYESMGWVRIP